MTMNFKIKEQKGLNYEQAKQAYIDGVRGKQFMQMFGLGTTAYSNLLKTFKEDGVKVKQGRRKTEKKQPRHYHRNLSKGINYWVVTKMIDGKIHYFGHYKTEAAAKAKVKELKQNNWGGLLE